MWNLIDAQRREGAPAPTARIAGISLIARQLRLAADQGWEGAVVICDPSDDQAVAQAIAKHPPPPDFQIEYIEPDQAPPAHDYVKTTATAVYSPSELKRAAANGKAPEATIQIDTEGDLRKASNELFAATRKSMEQDGILAYYIFRLFSRPLARALVSTPITPNMVTIFAMLLGFGAAICAAFGTYQMFVVAGALYLGSAVIDCIDGDLARLRVERSKLGEWLDTLADDSATYGLTCGLTIGINQGVGDWWLWFGLGFGVFGFLLQAKLYMDMHKWSLPIDTAQYPWFFGTPSQKPDGSSTLQKIAYPLAFIFRRDVHVTAAAVLLFCNLPKVAIVGVAFGVTVSLIMLIANMIVRTLRRRRGEELAYGAWSIGYFGVKDLFTLVNLAGGITGIYFAGHGQIRYAAYAIMGGYLFGDALDGLVARLSKTSNRFGAELDATADHIAQAIAPAIIAWAAFRLNGYPALGIAVMSAIIATASIRQARFQAASFNYPLTYCGLPRTVSGIVVIALPNAVLFEKYLSWPLASAVLFLVAALNLVPIPYMTHKGGRKMQLYVKVLVFAFLLVPVPMMFIAPRYVFDFIFVFTFVYAMTAWIPVRRDERREYWAEYKRWAAEIRS